MNRSERRRERDLRQQELLLQQEQEDLAPPGDEAALRLRAENHLQRRRRFRQHLLAYVLTVFGMLLLFTMLNVDGVGLWWVPGIVAAAWGPGVLIHGIDTYTSTGARAARRTSRVQQALRDAYGPQWYREASLAEQRIVRARAIAPLQRKEQAARQGLAFLLINVLLWFIWAAVTPGTLPWPLFVTLPTAVAFGVGFLNARQGPSDESALDREIERQRTLMAEAGWSDEKPKNDFAVEQDEPTLTVGPDGELVELVDDEESESAKRKRG